MKTTNKCNIFKAVRYIKRIIVHCSATPEGKAFHASDIDRWHKANGWNGIGYHYVIDIDGKVELGRNIHLVGAHATNYNTGSIGICYIGGTDKDGVAKDTRTPEQKESLLWLLQELKKLYPQAEILGHRDLPKVAKACPCFNAKEEYRSV